MPCFAAPNYHHPSLLAVPWLPAVAVRLPPQVLRLVNCGLRERDIILLAKVLQDCCPLLGQLELHGNAPIGARALAHGLVPLLHKASERSTGCGRGPLAITAGVTGGTGATPVSECATCPGPDGHWFSPVVIVWWFAYPNVVVPQSFCPPVTGSVRCQFVISVALFCH
jgi:hypothetical protein